MIASTTMIRSVYTFLTTACMLSFISCQDVIDIDLNSKEPAIVIEGNVTDQAGPYYVRVTRTVDFDQPNVFPGVSGAVVTLSDNSGNAEVLSELSPGTYATNAANTFAGVPGKNYFLKVETGGNEYSATSHLAPPVEIDAIYDDSLTFGGISNKYVNVVFTDPAGVKNYYRIIEVINGKELDRINLSNDEFEDGQQITVPVFSDEDPKLKSGDTVTIILQVIDEKVFDYFLELIQVINNGGQSAAPANPASNISNNALGYFSAHSVRSKTFVVP